MENFLQIAGVQNIKQSLRLAEQANGYDLTILEITHQEPEQSEQWQFNVGYVARPLGTAIPGKQIMLFQQIKIHPYFLPIGRATFAEVTI